MRAAPPLLLLQRIQPRQEASQLTPPIRFEPTLLPNSATARFCASPSSFERIGSNEAAVPCEIHKSVLSIRGDGLAMFAAILPNGPNPSQPLNGFATSVEAVLRRTGLDAFPEIRAPLQRRLESTVSPIQP